MKGSYVLLIELPKSVEIQVGHLGKIKFKTSFYAYVGSALGGLEVRISPTSQKGEENPLAHRLSSSMGKDKRRRRG